MKKLILALVLALSVCSIAEAQYFGGQRGFNRSRVFRQPFRFRQGFYGAPFIQPIYAQPIYAAPIIQQQFVQPVVQYEVIQQQLAYPVQPFVLPVQQFAYPYRFRAPFRQRQFFRSGY